MPARPVDVADATPVAGTTAPVDTIERPSPESNLRTTLTADPGSGGTTLAVGAGQDVASGFKVRVENEVMLVTAGGTGTSWTVTRAQDGTTGVAHAIGVVAARVVAVQRVEPVDASRIITFKGRAGTFRTPGRAGTIGQKILAIHNSTTSPVKVRVTSIAVDLVATVIKAVTVLPPTIRIQKFTALPTNGTALTKVATDSALASNSQVTLWGDASADGTASGTQLALTVTAGAIYSQEFAPRLITAAGYEMFDRETFLDGDSDFITLNALEGVALFLDYTLATQNPTTDMWVAQVEWEEYTAS